MPIQSRLSRVQRLIHAEIDSKIRKSNELLPDYELIFCPLGFPAAELKDWPDIFRRNQKKNTISIEKAIEFEALLPPVENARRTYIRWINGALLDISKAYPEVSIPWQIFEALDE